MAKRALLIGINRYRIQGADLRGCVNDVANMRSALIKYYKFPSTQIKTLIDGQATKKKMEAGIVGLLKSAKGGDVLYLHYSGHGANVPDADGDEADRRDEILCPTDLDWKDPLTDDWLRATIDKNLSSTANLTIVMDCCHSGSNTRALAPRDAVVINRYLPNPWDIAAEESGRAITGETFAPRAMNQKRGRVQSTRGAAKKSKTANRGLPDIALADMPEILITGCRDYQTSADAFIEGNFHGALTFHLVKSIIESKGKLSYRQLHRSATKGIKESGYDQVPQLEGRETNLDRLFLSPF